MNNEMIPKLTVLLLVCGMLLCQGCGDSSARKYYPAPAVADARIETNNGVSVVTVPGVAETMWYCPGAEIVNETDTEITIRFIRSNSKETAPLPAQDVMVSANKVESINVVPGDGSNEAIKLGANEYWGKQITVNNPSEKKIVIQ